MSRDQELLRVVEMQCDRPGRREPGTHPATTTLDKAQQRQTAERERQKKERAGLFFLVGLSPPRPPERAQTGFAWCCLCVNSATCAHTHSLTANTGRRQTEETSRLFLGSASQSSPPSDPRPRVSPKNSADRGTHARTDTHTPSSFSFRRHSLARSPALDQRGIFYSHVLVLPRPPFYRQLEVWLVSRPQNQTRARPQHTPTQWSTDQHRELSHSPHYYCASPRQSAKLSHGPARARTLRSATAKAAAARSNGLSVSVSPPHSMAKVTPSSTGSDALGVLEERSSSRDRSKLRARGSSSSSLMAPPVRLLRLSASHQD